MSRVELVGKPYVGRSLIASAQRSVNLFAESNSPNDVAAPTPITYYPTPGTVLYADSTLARQTRCTYRTSLGTGFVVVGPVVYFVNSAGIMTQIANIIDRPSQVYMADNGLVTVLVDGASGYVIDMATNRFAMITDPSFYGADFVVFLDTFFVFNRPRTNQFYLSASMANFGMFTNSAIQSADITDAGSGYNDGFYSATPLIGGTGSGATADVTVTSGYVTSLGVNNGGSGYTDGFYKSVAMDGGSGTDLRGDITISGGIVVDIGTTDDFAGSHYNAGDILTVSVFDIGGTGSGFTAVVNSVNDGVTLVNLSDPGNGYSQADELTIDIGSGSGFVWTITALATAFDPLDIAAKSGSADPIVGILAVHRELWLIGELTSEVWIGTGAADFFFQEVQGAFIDHGCAAPYSCSNQDIIGFWLMRDRQGNCIVVQSFPYSVKEISTPAIVKEFKKYSVVEDAIGMCFQVADHAFYCITFPTADKTWLYDVTTETWCEWNWCDDNGKLHRSRANCCMFLNDKNIIGDWEVGKLFSLEPNVMTDDGKPIVRIRTFPHMLDDAKRVFYDRFIIDMECGTGGDNENNDPNQPPFAVVPYTNNDFLAWADIGQHWGYDDGVIPVMPVNLVSLRWSDDRGRTYGNAVTQSLGKLGEYQTMPVWPKLGMARDRVFEISWSCPVVTALNGAFIVLRSAKS